MAALVVLDVSRASDAGFEGVRLDIFPGGATPSVFAAGAPFWIGYGFAVDTGAAGEGEPVSETTRFELDVDGVRTRLEPEILFERGVVARKTEIADFDAGLPVGWHTFHGRWYDDGRLVLSSRVTIEFVEP
jgi:hypothetical protein